MTTANTRCGITKSGSLESPGFVSRQLQPFYLHGVIFSPFPDMLRRPHSALSQYITKTFPPSYLFDEGYHSSVVAVGQLQTIGIIAG